MITHAQKTAFLDQLQQASNLLALLGEEIIRLEVEPAAKPEAKAPEPGGANGG